MSKKRSKDQDTTGQRKPKRAKTETSTKPTVDATPQSPSPSKLLRPSETDFPRGGGTNLTAIEYKALREEARKEVEEELFQVFAPAGRPRLRIEQFQRTANQHPRRNPRHKVKLRAIGAGRSLCPLLLKAVIVPAEYIHYRTRRVLLRRCGTRSPTSHPQNVTAGAKTLCQVISVKPLALVVSLPDHLVGHVPLTNISSIYSQRLEAVSEDSSELDSGDDDEESRYPPELAAMYDVGDYVRATITRVATKGTPPELGTTASTEEEKRSGRLELSLEPSKLNEGLAKGDFRTGLVRVRLLPLWRFPNIPTRRFLRL